MHELLRTYQNIFEKTFENYSFPFIIIENGWFRIEYTFVLNVKKEIKIIIFAEVHVFDFNGFTSVGTFGFHSDGDLFYGAENDPKINMDFTLKKNNFGGVDFNYYKYNAKNPVINLTKNSTFEMYNFINRIQESINSPYYVDFILKLNNISHSNVMLNQNEKLISENYLRSLVLPITYNKAVNYFESNRILNIEWRGDILRGLVRGHNNNTYNIAIEISSNRIRSHFCSCLAHLKYNGPCKHVVSLILASNNMLIC